ncbi:MAG: type II CRISPR-associated endonuclease Cas1 [Nitrospira sp.]|nr:type II CRISPR-associated endonuclease Cas1 [Nitrospira sp.]
MSWRGVHVSRPARLSLKRNALVVDQGEEPVCLPLEDVTWIVLDTQQATLTAGLIAACMESGIPLVVSDARHMPCGVVLPFHQHFRQARVAHIQTAASPAFKRRLWRGIVRAKILNQALTLERAGIARAATLKEMVRHVKPGDPGNVESRAARGYWPALLGQFSRQDEADRRNALLNYGYAVLRASIARSLVAAGLLPAFGIHHQGVQNAFNLADDLIEPYRPAVDWMAWETSGMGDAPDAGPLTLEDRQTMAGVLSFDVRFENQRMQVLTAIEWSVESLVRAFVDRDSSLLQLPVVW